jgi:hypothetical protein
MICLSEVVISFEPLSISLSGLFVGFLRIEEHLMLFASIKGRAFLVSRIFHSFKIGLWCIYYARSNKNRLECTRIQNLLCLSSAAI